jgi:hypothetical protein
MGRECSKLREKRKSCRILVGKSEGKRPLGRSRHKYEGNIKMDLREIGDRINLGEDMDQSRALANTVMNLWAP